VTQRAGFFLVGLSAHTCRLVLGAGATVLVLHSDRKEACARVSEACKGRDLLRSGGMPPCRHWWLQTGLFTNLTQCIDAGGQRYA
jgi:hypothetical protein